MNLALKIAIVKSGKRQQVVAQLAGLHVSQLSRLVNGKDQPTPIQRRNLAAVLGRPAATLFPGGRP